MIGLDYTFDFNITDIQVTISYLTFLDITACLTECSSGRGYCSSDLTNGDQLVCVCFPGYYGNACENTLSDYTTMVCLNGGTLVNNLMNETLTSSCLCPNGTFGDSCENKIDPCQNETCSDHGNCYLKQINETACKCNLYFHGDKCEFQSNELKTIKTLTTLTSYIAIATIIAFYSIIICMDVLKFLMRRDKGEHERFRRRRIWKPVYVNPY